MEITLLHGCVALIDDDAAALVAGYHWYAMRSKQTWYAVATVGTRKSGRRTAYLHRVVLGAAAGTSVDHINHNGLDCRRANLRYATHTEQNANQRKRPMGTSRFRGVHLHREPSGRVRWRAGVSVAGIQRRVLCATEIEAAIAYNRLARTAFGAFAKLNDVDEGA